MSGSTAISMAPPAGQLPVTRRKRTPVLIAGRGAAAVLVSATWSLLHLGGESTDDAQVEGRVMTVSARVPGQVLRVRVDDNQVVEAGDVWSSSIQPTTRRSSTQLARTWRRRG